MFLRSNMRKFIRSEIAVSEAVSFIQTLAIVIISTALVIAAGYPMLDKAQVNAHFQEMESAFIFLAQNIDSIGYDRAPIRDTELKIKGGAIKVAHDSYIYIGGEAFAMGSVEYIFDEKTIAYENGGVWTKYPGGEVVMLSKPKFSTGNITAIPVMEISGEGYMAGEGNMRIDSRFSSTEIKPIEIANNTNTYSIEINSSYYRGWVDYLTGIGAEIRTVDDAHTTVIANLTANNVSVDHNIIRIKILES